MVLNPSLHNEPLLVNDPVLLLLYALLLQIAMVETDVETDAADALSGSASIASSLSSRAVAHLQGEEALLAVATGCRGRRGPQ